MADASRDSFRAGSLYFFPKRLIILHVCFVSFPQYLQMKWPLLDVQAGTLQSRQALKDARSPSPAHIVVSDVTKIVALYVGDEENALLLEISFVYLYHLFV